MSFQNLTGLFEICKIYTNLIQIFQLICDSIGYMIPLCHSCDQEIIIELMKYFMKEPFVKCVAWIEKKIGRLLLYFSAANGSRWRTSDSIMQSGRIYIGMMFSPVESVSTWPDAPFKCVYAAFARKPSSLPVVFSIPNSSAV